MFNPFSMFSSGGLSSAASAMAPFVSTVNPIAGIGMAALGGYAGAAAEQQAADKAFNRQVELTKMNQEYQTSERLAAQEYNTLMWNAQNEYNSIGAQIERAKAAGVNPNAVLGMTSGNLASTPAASHGQAGGIAGAIPAVSGDAQSRSAQLTALISDVANKDADTDNKKVTKEILEESLDQAAQKTIRDKFEYTIFVDKSLKEIKMLNKQLDILEKEYQIKDQTVQNLKTSGDYDKLKLEFAKALGVPLEASETDKLLHDYISGGLTKVTKRLQAIMGGDAAQSVDDALGKLYDTITSFLPSTQAQKVINIVKNVFGSGNNVKQ